MSTTPDPDQLPSPDPSPERSAVHVDASHTGPARRRRVVVIALSTALVLVLGAATYLWVTERRWEDRSGELTATATDLGSQLATTQSDLHGAVAELEAVRGQLGTAQSRITELADEKAQVGDDREVQRQLADYQARISEAAGTVASALDQCIQGQQMLIGYLQNQDQYDDAEVAGFTADVQALCQSATDANLALQRELAQ